MSIFNQIAQGVNIDPVGSFLRTRNQLETQQIQRNTQGLQQMLMQAQRGKLLAEINDKKTADSALRGLAGQVLPLVTQLDTPDAKLAAARLQSGNLAQMAEGLKMSEKILGPEKITGIFDALDPQTGKPVIFMRGERGGRISTGLEAPPKTGQTINLNTQGETDAVEAAIIKANIEDYEQSRVRGRDAEDGLRKAAQARRLLQTAKVGSLAELQTRVGKLAQFFGLDPANFGITGDEIADNEALQRLQLEMAQGIFAQFKGAISDREFNQIMASSPGIDKTAEGNARMLDIIEDSLKFNRELYRAQRKYFEKNRTFSGWEEERSRMVDAFIANQTRPED